MLSEFRSDPAPNSPVRLGLEAELDLPLEAISRRIHAYG